MKTDQGFVIEFQHSHLDPHERAARETFYQNMVWVVDGTRLKGDYPRFFEGRKNFISGHQQGLLPDPLHEYINAYNKQLAQEEELRELQIQNQRWQPRKSLRAIIPKRRKKN